MRTDLRVKHDIGVRGRAADVVAEALDQAGGRS